MTRAHRIPVPAGAVPPGTDYAVAFRLYSSPGPATAEQWARGVFEGPPAAVRLFLQLGWRMLLRLRLGPTASPDNVGGWPIADDTQTRCVLRTDSPLLTASNRAEVDDEGVLWVTEVNYKSRLGHALWALAAPIHQWTLPIFLRIAAHKVGAR